LLPVKQLRQNTDAVREFADFIDALTQLEPPPDTTFQAVAGWAEFEPLD
jgi:hypothetical protein